MRSDSLDFSSFETINMPIYKKIERSHEENQERAYIAASRRTDRRLEARVQSARMASDIHKRRTGKSFIVTEEIVMKEEMYEEDDDDLPRSYGILGANMQTSSPHMNSRVESYLSNKANMSAMLARSNEEWRQNEVNTLFDQIFPDAMVNQLRNAAVVHHRPQHLQETWLQQQHQPGSISHHQSKQQYANQQYQQQQPMPQQFQQTQQPPRQFCPQPHISQHSQVYPPSAAGQYPLPPDFSRHDSAIGDIAILPAKFDSSSQPDSPIDLGCSRSAFITDLPTEARVILAGAPEMQGYEHPPHSWASVDPSFDMPGVSCLPKDDEQLISLSSETFETTNLKWDLIAQPMLSVDDTYWNTFMNESAWASDQQ